MPDGSVSDPEPDADSVLAQPVPPVADPERLRQRAVFLRELAEARALLARAAPGRERPVHLRTRLRG